MRRSPGGKESEARAGGRKTVKFDDRSSSEGGQSETRTPGGEGPSAQSSQELCSTNASCSERPPWVNDKADGSLMEGGCFQQIVADARAKRWTGNLLNYYGMYSVECGCDWCLDRLAKVAEIKKRQEWLGCPAPEPGPPGAPECEQAPPQQPEDETEVDAVQYQKWKTSRYAVRKEVIKDILMRLQCPTPELDAFADAGNFRFKKYWGKGGAAEDAWSQDWAEEKVGLIWCNPPFEDLQWVVERIMSDGAKAILIAPDWRTDPFFKPMWEIVQRCYYYKPGIKFFELDDREVPLSGNGVYGQCWSRVRQKSLL